MLVVVVVEEEKDFLGEREIVNSKSEEDEECVGEEGRV